MRTDFVRVTWKPPLRPNGAIVSYEVQHKVKDSKDDFAVVAQPRSGPDVRSADVSGLIGNRYYIFRVYAKTRLGRGIPAEELVFTSPNRRKWNFINAGILIGLVWVKYCTVQVESRTLMSVCHPFVNS